MRRVLLVTSVAPRARGPPLLSVYGLDDCVCMSPEDEAVQAHDQPTSHHYTVHYPEHPAREDDPHYRDFEHIHRTWRKDPQKWQCAIGKHRGDFSECDLSRPLELHHTHVEFSMQNGVSLDWLEVDYPGISDPDTIGAWVESADNLEVLCVRHHRGHGGIHVAAAADFEAQKYVRKLID